MNKLLIILIFSTLLFGCEDSSKPTKPTTYSGYFKILLRNEIYESHGDNHSQNYKHFFVQGIKDTFLFCDISQHDYSALTDSLYYVKKVGDVIKFDNIDENSFVYGEKSFLLVKQ